MRIYKSIIYTLTLVVIGLLNLHAQKFEGLALTPPMGWNHWNAFHCEINEQLFYETVDAMVKSGMRDVGYQYVVIDDCWHGGRDSYGKTYADSSKFPSGIKVLADYAHSKGLKLGIYSDAGTYTCADYPGSRGYEYQDALTYAEWGIDFLKYDWCYTDSLNAFWAYTTMRDALYKTGRPILFSICEWGRNNPWTWGKEVGHMWRICGDITSKCFDCEIKYNGWSNWGPMQVARKGNAVRKYSGPDHWNDFDMLEVGNGLSENEDRSHFSIWCMLAAPLMTGNDIRNMSEQTIKILTNREAIAINQDSLGIQGFIYKKDNYIEIWAKPLANEEWAVCFYNEEWMKTKKLEFDWKDNIIQDEIFKKELNANKHDYLITDIWTGEKLGNTGQRLIKEIASHDVLMLRLTKK